SGRPARWSARATTAANSGAARLVPQTTFHRLEDPTEPGVAYSSRPLSQEASMEMSGMTRVRPSIPASEFWNCGRGNTKDRPPPLCGQAVAGTVAAPGDCAPSRVPPTAVTSGRLAGQPIRGGRYTGLAVRVR